MTHRSLLLLIVLALSTGPLLVNAPDPAIAAPNAGSAADVAIDSSPAPPPAPGDYDRWLATGDGLTRTYALHLPPAITSGKPLPLVLVLHGSPGDGTTIAAMTGMSDEADQAGFIVAYPDGFGFSSGRYSWNAYACCDDAWQQNVDDAGFLRALVTQLEHDYAIDAGRVYATGFSNGGMMSYRLACEDADVFVAVASVSGSMDTQHCRPARPVSVLEIHGTADPIVPFEGGSVDGRVDRPVRATVAAWSRIDGCRRSSTAPPSASLTLDLYGSCRAGTEVGLIAIAGGTHLWPGSAEADGTPDAALSATKVIWDFFAAHPRRR